MALLWRSYLTPSLILAQALSTHGREVYGLLVEFVDHHRLEGLVTCNHAWCLEHQIHSVFAQLMGVVVWSTWEPVEYTKEGVVVSGATWNATFTSASSMLCCQTA